MIFEEIMAKTYPKLVRDVPQIQEAQQLLSRINKKKDTRRHIFVKLLINKD